MNMVKTLDNSELSVVEFITYIQSIISSGAGFIKTDGFMAHLAGEILLVSADRTVFSYIKIPIIVYESFSANINSLLGLKSDEEKDDYVNRTYLFGGNQILNELTTLASTYKMAEWKNGYESVFYAEDCIKEIEGFQSFMKSPTVSYINISNGKESYSLYGCKAMFPVNAGDTISLNIYKPLVDNGIRICMYNIYKKKNKTRIKIFFRFLLLK